MSRPTPPFHPFRTIACRCHRLAGFVLTTCGVLLCAVSLAVAAASGPTEYQVKAAFLFNFLKFTEWPSTAFTSHAAPLVIGVAGEDPFGRTLDDLVEGELVNGRPIVIKRFQSGDESSACHVLFVSRAQKNRLFRLLENIRKEPVLTVSDLDQFCQQGGMINLVLSSTGTVRPEINPDAARMAGVQISSKLLHLPSVKLVKTEP